MKVYLAGPLFSTAERDFNAQLTARLRALGHEIFLPQESEQGAMTAREIFQSDVAGVDWSDAVVANMDGPDPDSGTCWECGYAYGKKFIVLFRTDFRVGHEIRDAAVAQDEAPYNLMLTESADARLDLPFKTVDEVAAAIDRALDALRDKPVTSGRAARI
jgi:nucleoside 2-deoxyribosyltransferase